MAHEGGPGEVPTRRHRGDSIQNDDARLAPGTEVADYIVNAEIGKGGMGIVYSATHKVIGKRAALKVLRPEVSKSAVTVARFLQEARAVNQIGHPNIVEIFAFGTLPDGRAYHLMDLLVGESLRKRLRRGPLHPSEAASVIDEIAVALSAAHAEGYIHRDLKPENIYLVPVDGRWPEVKLLDFGLAKLMPEVGVAAFKTTTGLVLGTPEYMSPEQSSGLGVDHRTDIYALGVLMFEILTGERPFPSTGDSFAMLQLHAEEQPPSLAQLMPSLPDEMVQLVETMLAKQPDDRPSLAAVRTVIKRLRALALPTRSAAGLEISPTGPSTTPAPPPVAVARVDAAPRPGASPIPAVALAAARSPATALAAAAAAAKSAPTNTTLPYPPPSTSPVSVRSSALAGHPATAHPSTVLGVPPPPVPAPSPRQAAIARAARSSRIWLFLGAILAIAAGVALALVIVST